MTLLGTLAFFEALQINPFLSLALIAGLVASIASGITGSFIVVKRIVFISGSIAHSVLGGMGLFLWIKRTFYIDWITPLQGAIVAALASALFMSWIKVKYKEREDSIIAALWSTGMALGVIFVALTPGYNVELMNFLFGNILWVSTKDIMTLIALDIAVAAITLIYYKRFQAVCFDEDQGELQGLSTNKIYSILLCMIALSIVLLIQVVGSILVIAILAIPAAVASYYTNKLATMIFLSIGLAMLFTTLGTFISYEWNWPPGATISLTAASIYAITLLIKGKTARSV
ncbi:MAG: metal ABC transporter permease [Chlamydiae bacterium]|nr:metal ABC transporter permease [Chlamydiota bacterium]